MKTELARVANDIDPKELATLLSKRGAVIVESLLDQRQLQNLNSELDTAVALVAPGSRHPTQECLAGFFGRKTIRLDGLPGKAPTFLEIMQMPQLAGVADEILLPNCDDYLLNTGQVIQIGPGEKEQELHRDEDVWSFLQDPKPIIEVVAMIALSPFAAANGATRVVPGSHLWPNTIEPKPEEIVPAEMEAGSALFYLGSTLHGGGKNNTVDNWRRGVFIGFVLGWLRMEENTFLSVPIEAVKKMPVRCQELLGYKAHGELGWFDVGDPMEVLK